jgi:hypothetical protein
MTDFLDCMRPPIPDERRQPCTKRTWCVLDEGHDGDCVEVPRRDLPPSDFGPERAKRRRW